MILTVTPNSAVDKILFIEEWVTGTPMRTDRIVTSVGGKGLDSSVTLSHLGVETVGLTFVAGATGEELVRLLEAYGIIPEPIWVDGETRTAHVIVETKHHRHSHIIAGQLRFTENHIVQFMQRYRTRVQAAQWVICAGSIPDSLPQALYRDCVEEAARVHVPVLIDSQRSAILETLPADPAIVKMNWEEFEWTFGTSAPTLEDLKHQARELFNERNLKALVLTCSSDGILAFSAQGAFHARPPRQKSVNAAGAGDAVSSALTWRLSMGDHWPEALKWAGATSAAVVLTEGTADCHMEDVRRIYPDVQVETF